MPDPIHDQLLETLQKYGSRLMARHALEHAEQKLNLDPEHLSGPELEKLVEEVMSGFRVFCETEARQKLWIELINIIETHALG